MLTSRKKTHAKYENNRAEVNSEVETSHWLSRGESGNATLATRSDTKWNHVGSHALMLSFHWPMTEVSRASFGVASIRRKRVSRGGAVTSSSVELCPSTRGKGYFRQRNLM